MLPVSVRWILLEKLIAQYGPICVIIVGANECKWTDAGNGELGPSLNGCILSISNKKRMGEIINDGFILQLGAVLLGKCAVERWATRPKYWYIVYGKNFNKKQTCLLITFDCPPAIEMTSSQHFLNRITVKILCGRQLLPSRFDDVCLQFLLSPQL